MVWRVEAINVPAGSGILVAGTVRVFGWSFHETTKANPAHLRLWDGGAASGTLVNPVALSADQSTRDWLGPHGLQFSVGLFYEAVDGAVEGSVWVGYPEHDPTGQAGPLLTG